MQIPAELANQITYLIFTALLTALTALIALGLHKLNAYVNAKIGVSNFDFLKQLAATVVRSLEQSPAFKDFDGAKKKEAAIMQMTEFAKRYGIPVSAETISKLVEEEVQRMNSQLIDLAPEE